MLGMQGGTGMTQWTIDDPTKWHAIDWLAIQRVENGFVIHGHTRDAIATTEEDAVRIALEWLKEGA